MTLQELENQLHGLTPIERAEALRILTRTLSTAGRRITRTLDVMGGDACLDNSRLPV